MQLSKYGDEISEGLKSAQKDVARLNKQLAAQALQQPACPRKRSPSRSAPHAHGADRDCTVNIFLAFEQPISLFCA